MHAYIWCEQDADKGSKNICSCLLKYFKIHGWLQKNYVEPTKVADNCGGQNKNQMVVRLFLWLVDMNYFPRTNLIFLVKCHAKNATDRLFYLLKTSYYRLNVYTYDMLVNAFINDTFIKAHKVELEEMFNSKNGIFLL